jgi:hypothetical protein
MIIVANVHLLGIKTNMKHFIEHVVFILRVGTIMRPNE